MIKAYAYRAVARDGEVLEGVVDNEDEYLSLDFDDIEMFESQFSHLEDWMEDEKPPILLELYKINLKLETLTAVAQQFYSVDYREELA